MNDSSPPADPATPKQQPAVSGATPTEAPTMPDADDRPRDEALEALVVEVMKTVYDPEIPVDIYELGLVYDVKVFEGGEAHIRFTLTSPNCPAAQSLPEEMERKTRAIEGIEDAKMDLTWEPPWTPDMMSQAAKLRMNML